MDGFRVGFETSYASHRCIRTLGTYSHHRRVLRAPTRAPEPAEPRRTPWPRCTDSHLLMIGGKLPKPSTQFEFSLRWWNRGGELSCRDRSGFRPDVGTDRPAKPRGKTFFRPPDWASGHQSEECFYYNYGFGTSPPASEVKKESVTFITATRGKRLDEHHILPRG